MAGEKRHASSATRVRSANSTGDHASSGGFERRCMLARAKLLTMHALAWQSTSLTAEALSSCVADGVCAEVALVRLLGILRTIDELKYALSGRFEPPLSTLAASVIAIIEADERGARAVADVLAAEASHVAALLEADERGARSVAEILSTEAQLAHGQAGVDQTIVAVARWFDFAVQESEEVSVAAYSLGSPRKLEAATREVVRAMASFGVLAAERTILQIGCGIGRFEAALGSRVRRVFGIDVSPLMIEAARRRCAGLANVELRTCSGRDLEPFADRSVDLVYAIDSFPYLLQAGERLVATHFREARRVLRAGGDFVIFNFSYRGDLRADKLSVARLARAFGFEVLRTGERPLKLWDGTAFHLRAAD